MSRRPDSTFQKNDFPETFVFPDSAFENIRPDGKIKRSTPKKNTHQIDSFGVPGSFDFGVIE